MSDQFKTEVVQVATSHVLEDLFGIEPGSTMVNRLVVAEEDEDVPEVITPVVQQMYDDKDSEIDNQFQQVFNAAFMTFEAQRMSTEGMNPQFQARALEVAQQFLNTALAAASEKAKLKAAKDKVAKPVANVNNTTNNLVMDRDTMLRMLMNSKADSGKIIDTN